MFPLLAGEPFAQVRFHYVYTQGLRYYLEFMFTDWINSKALSCGLT